MGERTSLNFSRSSRSKRRVSFTVCEFDLRDGRVAGCGRRAGVNPEQKASHTA